MRRPFERLDQPTIESHDEYMSEAEWVRLRRDFLLPFRGNHLWKRHLRPEWVGDGIVRLRIFHGPHQPGADVYYNQRFCLGLAVIRATQTNIVAEMHQPFPRHDPLRIAARFTPATRELVMMRQPLAQLNLEDNRPNIADWLAVEDQREASEELELLRRNITDIMAASSKFTLAYRIPQGKPDMRDTSFSLDIFRRPGEFVEQHEFELMKSMVYSL